MTISLNSNNSIHLIDSKSITWNVVQKRNDCVVDISATAKFYPCETLLTGMILDIPCAAITQKDTICSAFSKLQCQLTEISSSGVLTVTDDGSGVVVVDNTDPQNPIVGFGGVNVDGVTITGDGSVGNPLVSAAGAPFITSIADTNTIDLDATLGVLTANLRYVDSAEFDLSDSAAGFTGVLKTTGVVAGTYGDSGNVGQFTVDSKGRLTSATNVAIVIAEPNTQIVYGTGAGIDSNADFTFDLVDVTLLNGTYVGKLNSNAIYSSVILQNLTNFISYITWKDTLSVEKFYVGYRQQNLAFDILSEANGGVGIRMDENGRVVIGTRIGAYTAPDTSYPLSIDSITSTLNGSGTVWRKNESTGGIPLDFQHYNTLVAYVKYSGIASTIVVNTAGAHTGRITVDIAKAGAIITPITFDSTGISLSPHGVAAGNTYEQRFLELAASGTNYVGFKSPDAIAANVIWTLPNADATVSGYVLSSNAAGLLSWVNATGAGGTVPAGTTGQTLYYAAAGTTVTPTSNLYNDGTNVGIGGTPTQLFDVMTGTDSWLKVKTGGDVELGDTDGTNLVMKIKVRPTSGIINIGDNDGAGGSLITLDANTAISSYTAGNGHEFGGNIAINTALTANALEVNGNASITGKLTVTGAIDPTHLYLDEQAGDPANVANKGILYTKDVATLTQLFYMDSAGTVKNISATGTVTTVSVVTANGASGSVATATTTPAITLSFTTQAPADNSTKVATTAYVDNAILGQNFKEAAKYATTGALPAVVYANGSSGVGATLTGVAFGAISTDSASPSVGDRLLVKNQVSTLQNGWYTVTATGSGIAVFVLTRSTDADQTTDFKTGDSGFVTSGTTQSATTWAYTGIDNPVMGTDVITFVQTAGVGSFTGGNGITITGTSIAIDTSVTVDINTAQALTNKTISGNTFTTGTGTLTLSTFTLTVAGTASVSGTNTGDQTLSGLGGANTALSNLAAVAINTSLLLGASDGGALGSTTFMWSDLFLASGSVINFNAGDVTITHASNLLTFAGASSGYIFNTLIRPLTNDGTALGGTSLGFSDLFLASGGVIDWNNGDVAITHSTDTLAISGTTSVSFNSNVVIGGTTLATSSTAGLHLYNGTIPSASIVDGFVMYAADFGATSMPHFRGENGDITKLFTSSGTLVSLGDMFTSYVQHGFFAANGFTVIATAEGGTGLAGVFGVGDIFIGNGNLNPMVQIPDVATGNALISGGVLTAPSWGKIGLTTHISGVLPIANGGSNKALTLVNGGVLWTDADSFEVTAAGTQNQVLISNGAAAPSWSVNPIGLLEWATGSGNTVALSTTNYAQFFFGQNVGASETVRTITLLQACTVKNLCVRTSNTQSATGSLVIMIRKNSADTTLTLTLAAGQVAGTFTDVSNSFTVAVNDTISIQIINNATATSANILEISCWMYL